VVGRRPFRGDPPVDANNYDDHEYAQALNAAFDQIGGGNHSIAESLHSAGTQSSVTRVLNDVLDDTMDLDEVEIRNVRWVTLFLAISVAAMAVVNTVIVNLGSQDLHTLSALTLVAGQRAVLYEATVAWIEAALVVNAYEHLNMTKA